LEDEEHIRRRIEVRISQGEFLAGMLHVAARSSAQAQESFVERLCAVAAAVRGVFDANGLIRRLEYRPNAYWPSIKGQEVAFLDGGVANIDLPSAAPIGIRVGSYTVRPGERDLSKRERFDIALSVVDDLYAEDGATYDDDFLDQAKLRDAARIISETAAVWHLVKGDNCPNAVLLHGPLVNPAAPYGLEDFPSYSLPACRRFLDDPGWNGDDEQRQFVALYAELLKRIAEAGKTAIGVVERSVGKEPVVTRTALYALQDAGTLREKETRDLLQVIKTYGLNDATLLDVVLSEGEYLKPIPVMRQGPENKWPDAWKTWIRSYPNALTTYLKPSELTVPFRVEAFEREPAMEGALELVLHTSRLLPSYGFPVGLDIVDKFAKVPEWMSKGIRGQHQVVLLKKALESGDPRALTFAKRVLTAQGRDWFFRPTA
jgi:hypothetical protein